MSDGQVSVGVVSDEQEAKLVEADLYVLGQFIEEMRAGFVAHVAVKDVFRCDDRPVEPAEQVGENINGFYLDGLLRNKL